MNKAYKSYYCNEFQDRNINCDNNEHITKKIILNKRSDLLNIPIQQLRTAQLKNFSGKLFEQIYKEAFNSFYKSLYKKNKGILKEKTKEKIILLRKLQDKRSSDNCCFS